ncbi:MAG: hypothetical protein FWD69_19495 [Polyangiaceae bacterium]|nr:hypothetical protein [Polyangiaceae bacterium]
MRTQSGFAIAVFTVIVIAAVTADCIAHHAATPVTQAPAPAVDASSTDKSKFPRCDLARGYQGRVVGQPVFARLADQGGEVHGRYFYEKIGVDIALRGSLQPDGTLSLVEGDPRAPSGRFEGSCQPSTGVLEGSWTGPRTNGPFRLEPIAPQDPPIVAEKHFSIQKQRPGAPGEYPWTCTYTETTLEFFGIQNGDVERRMNRGGFFEPSTGPWLAPETAERVRTCNVYRGFVAKTSEVVIGDGTFRQFVSVARGGDGFETVELQTYDLQTGRVVNFADVFAKDPLPLILACAKRVGAHVAGTEDRERQLWSGTVFPPASTGYWAIPSERAWSAGFLRRLFYLSVTGVWFVAEFAEGFVEELLNESAIEDFIADGHPIFRLNPPDGQGPLLPYSVLKRDGYLREDSSVERAWESIAPAAPGVQACPAGHESEWWK